MFATTIWADTGRTNTYSIEIADATGRRREVTPGTFSYTVGAIETQPPLIHTISVGSADNTIEPLIARNTPLPTRGRKRLRTTVAVHPGTIDGLNRIPVLEGEHTRADRNRTIGRLDITADQIQRSVPQGSDVELTLEIDASRIMIARASVPYLDTEFENVIDLHTERAPEARRLQQEAAAELPAARDPRAAGAVRRAHHVRPLIAEIDGPLYRREFRTGRGRRPPGDQQPRGRSAAAAHGRAAPPAHVGPGPHR